MSIMCLTACLDCGVFAPEVGAFGYIGFPSLDTSRGPEGQPPHFGYLYEAFAGIRLVTWHLDLLGEFFERHSGHRVHTFAEDEPLFGSGGAGAVPPEPDDVGLYPFELQEAAWTDATAAAYPLAQFRIDCATCNAQYLSEARENIRRFSKELLPREAVRLFCERIGGQLDPYTFMHAAPLDGADALYPELTALLSFLTDHGGHQLSASMVLEG